MEKMLEHKRGKETKVIYMQNQPFINSIDQSKNKKCYKARFCLKHFQGPPIWQRFSVLHEQSHLSVPNDPLLEIQILLKTFQIQVIIENTSYDKSELLHEIVWLLCQILIHRKIYIFLKIITPRLNLTACKFSEIWTAEKVALVSHTRKLQSRVHTHTHRWFTGSSCQLKQDPGPDDLSHSVAREDRPCWQLASKTLACLFDCAVSVSCGFKSVSCSVFFRSNTSPFRTRVEGSRVTLSHDTRKNSLTGTWHSGE